MDLQDRRNHPWTALTAALLITAFFAAGCSFAMNRAMPFFDNANAAVEKHSDYELIKAGIPANIIIIEGLIETAPKNKNLRILAAQTYCVYALGFVEDEDPRRASDLYLRGRDHGLVALRANRRIAEALDAGIDEFEEAAAALGEKDLPALFWTANCWGSWINFNIGSMEALSDLPRVKILMRRTLEIDDTFFFGGAHLFFGILDVSIPRMAGGSPERSKEHFDRAFEISDGKFLLPYVLFAQHYAAFMLERELFEDTLKMVLDAPRDLFPEQVLANEIAKKKAARLIGQADELF
ncbi:TRAP transporter TatT component family protein [Thermodesulfobacteriota bacterium]